MHEVCATSNSLERRFRSPLAGLLDRSVPDFDEASHGRSEGRQVPAIDASLRQPSRKRHKDNRPVFGRPGLGGNRDLYRADGCFSTSTLRVTTRTSAGCWRSTRRASQARCLHDEEHHDGTRPRAGTSTARPHQPHSTVCPGRRCPEPGACPELYRLQPRCTSAFRANEFTSHRKCTLCVRLEMFGGSLRAGERGRRGERSRSGVMARTGDEAVGAGYRAGGRSGDMRCDVPPTVAERLRRMDRPGPRIRANDFLRSPIAPGVWQIVVEVGQASDVRGVGLRGARGETDCAVRR